MAHNYYYAEVSFGAGVVLAYKDMTKHQIDNVMLHYMAINGGYSHGKLKDKRCAHTFIFGVMEDLPKMGEIGAYIERVAIPYKRAKEDNDGEAQQNL